MEQEALFLARVEDDVREVIEGNYTVTTRFLTPEEQVIAKETVRGRVRIFASGGYPEAERRVLAFCPDYINTENEVDFGIRVVRVQVKQATLGHRDYLGAVLSLGMKRETIGDIALDGDGAWIFCMVEMAEYICRNLDKIGRASVTCEPMEVADAVIPPRTFEIKDVGVASLRLDAVLAGILHNSRSKAVEIITAGEAFLNHKEAKNISQKVKEGDVLSVRRFGKFVIMGVLGQTKKGRQKVQIKQYR